MCSQILIDVSSNVSVSEVADFLQQNNAGSDRRERHRLKKQQRRQKLGREDEKGKSRKQGGSAAKREVCA